MSWLVFAFSGPVLWAISTHLDKYLVEKYFKHSDVAVLLLFTAFIGVLTLPFIAFREPTVFKPTAGSIALIVLSGVLYMGAMLFYLRALQSEDASVVAPFFQAVPLFGYVLAYFVLGETLSIRQIAGGALIVAGTLIVSVGFGRNVRVFKLRLAMLMLACGFAAALSGLIFKIFAIEVEFWTTTFWMSMR
jgi:drug/metabolite transporter (DMT)-like permease